MRAVVVLVAVVGLTAVGFAPAGALVDPVDPVCDDACQMASAGAGYVPPANVVLSGATVSWSSLDTSHVNADGTGTSNDAPPCFAVGYHPADPSAGVTFTIDNAQLTATVNGATKVCHNARGGEDGFVLPYYCTIHPPMRGVLVVVP